ncbi:MAG TPA: O-antigen ligase family protein [Gaiellaceae bacterium]
MTSRAIRVGLRPGTALPTAFLGLALAVGVLATHNVTYAVAAVVGAALLLLVASKVDALPLFLVLTMFTESVALGPGLRIGRFAAVMALAVVVFQLLAVGARGLRMRPLLAVALGLGLWMLASALWAGDSGYVGTYLLHYLLAASYMLTFALLVRTPPQLIQIFRVLALGAFVFGAFSFAGYVTSGSQYLAHGIGAVGLQGDHNYFATYQAFSLSAALLLAALEQRPGRRFFWYAVVAVIALSVVASLSRSGLLALIGAVLVTLALPWHFFFRRRSHKLALVGALVVASVGVGLAGSTPFLQRAASIVQQPAVSGHGGSGRIDLWRAAWHGYSEHPYFGLGSGNFESSSVVLLQETPGTDISAHYALGHYVVHNMYLETLTELGPVGLGLLLAILVLAGRTCLGARRRARRLREREIELASVALLVGLVAFAIGGVFLSIQLNKPLWILIGLALSLEAMLAARAPEET